MQNSNGVGGTISTKKSSIDISKVLRRQALHIMAFGFVAGYRKQNDKPMIEAVRQFQLHFNIKEDDWQADSIIREIHRMTVEYLADGV